MAIVDIWPELVTVTENAALACSTLIGARRKKDADALATEAMREAFRHISVSGKIVIGEGERDEAPMLYIGEKVGKGGIEIDIAVDPLEGTNMCADNLPSAISVLAAGPKGSLAHAPDMYMDKIIVGPEVGEIDLAMSTQERIACIAKGHNISVEEVSIIIMDRPRSQKMVEEILSIGATVRMLADGEVAAMREIFLGSAKPVHAMMGVGAAPEGVIMATATRALGGYMTGRFCEKNPELPISPEMVERMQKMGIQDVNKVYTADELATGDDLVLVATGVTTGPVLEGVTDLGPSKQTDTLVLSTGDHPIRKIQTLHN